MYFLRCNPCFVLSELMTRRMIYKNTCFGNEYDEKFISMAVVWFDPLFSFLLAIFFRGGGHNNLTWKKTKTIYKWIFIFAKGYKILWNVNSNCNRFHNIEEVSRVNTGINKRSEKKVVRSDHVVIQSRAVFTFTLRTNNNALA